jgi:hypothetical protein
LRAGRAGVEDPRGPRSPRHYATEHEAEEVVSRCIDLFIDAPGKLDDLVAELQELADLLFTPDPDGSGYLTRQGDVLLSVGEHDFVDDQHLPLSSYRYDLCARVSTNHPLDSPEAHLLRHVLSLLNASRKHPALLVFDLQRVIGRADGSAPTTARS